MTPWGSAGLADQSRRPHRSPAALDPVLLAAPARGPRTATRYWGPRKLLRLVGAALARGALARALHGRALLPAPGAGPNQLQALYMARAHTI